MAACTKGRCCKFTSCAVGLVALITGCVLIKVFDNLIHDKVDDGLPLKEGSTSYQNWVSSPTPIYFQVYVQHVANALEVMDTGAKPVLEQRGPYTYRESRQKSNITYQAENGTVSYREQTWYHFDLSRSVGPESDNFTTVSMVMLTVVNMLRFEYKLVKLIVNEVLEKTGERLFLNLTVGQLLWGYNDTLLKDFKDALADIHIKLPISDQFGLFLGKNGSDDGVYEIYSGIGGHIDQFAEIVSWNGQTSLNYWKSTIANSLNGSDGTLFPPFVDTSKTKYLFSSDLCRSLQIQYTHGYGLKGIDVDRFVVPPLTFANVSVNPYNQGFCTPHCLPAGLLNASVCKAGAPVILSLPHFLDGDPDVLDRVIGMKPNRSAHQSVIDIEPMTGVVMNAAKRLQLNAYLTNISQFKDLEQLHGWIALPILWLSESATIDDKSAADFRGKVLVAVKVTEAVQFGLIALGAVLLLGVAVVVIKKAFFSSRDRELQVVGETTPILSSA